METMKAKKRWIWLIAAALTLGVAAGARFGFFSLSIRNPMGESLEVVTLREQFGNMTPEQKQTALTEAIRSPNPSMRQEAIELMGEWRLKETVSLIEGAFADSFADTRMASLRVLPRLDPDRGARLLVSALQDHDRQVRRDAANQLKFRKDKRALPALVRALDDEDEITRIFVMGALHNITNYPIRIKASASSEVHQQAVQRWKRWWETAKKDWQTEIAWVEKVKPVHPTHPDETPSLTIKMGDRSVMLGELKGKVVMLHFWGTWCHSCLNELSILKSIHEDYDNQPFALIGLAVEEEKDSKAFRKFCEQHQIRYPQAMVEDSVAKLFHVRGIPTTILIDAEGNIRYRWEGERDGSTFRKAIDRLLMERS